MRKFVTVYKTPLSLFSTANLAFIVWQVLSSAQQTREYEGGGKMLVLAAQPVERGCVGVVLEACTQLALHPGAAVCGRGVRDPCCLGTKTHPTCASPYSAAVLEQPFVGVVYVILLSAAQHVIYLGFNFLVST